MKYCWTENILVEKKKLFDFYHVRTGIQEKSRKAGDKLRREY
jgi:hypothetical protein